MTDLQTYTGNNHVVAPGIHIAIGNPTFKLRYRGKEWLTEWHYYFGPMVINKRTGDQVKNPPDEKSPFWRVVQWWKDQGAKVVDGVGVWEEPPIVTKRYSRFKRGLIEDVTGDIVMRFWKDYEHLGEVR